MLIGLNRRKFKRLASNPTLWRNFFEVAEFGGTTEKDPITNVEFDPNEKPVLLNDADEDTVLVSPLTKQQIDTGRALRNANYWATAKTTAFLGSREYEIQDPFKKYHWLEESDAKSSGEGEIRELNRFSGKEPWHIGRVATESRKWKKPILKTCRRANPNPNWVPSKCSICWHKANRSTVSASYAWM